MTDTAKARNYNGLTEDNLLLFFQGFIINLSIDFITNLSRDLLLGVVIKKKVMGLRGRVPNDQIQ